MDKFIIEHPGTEYYTELANELQALLEFEYGLDVEQMIGYSTDNLHLSKEIPGTNTLEHIAELQAMPSKEALDMYVKWA